MRVIMVQRGNAVHARDVRCMGTTLENGAGPMQDPIKLRELAAWYREFAEKTGNPSLWEARLRMAEDLEQEATRLEQRQATALELS
jgi:hypothetical protein